MFRRPNVRYGRHPRARDALSARRPGLGRADRLRPCAGAKIGGSRFFAPRPVRRPRWRSRLAVGAQHDHPLGGAGRSARRGAGGRAGDADYRPTDPEIAWHLARFITEVRGIPADPVVLRQDWLDAYNYVTDKGALALNDYARRQRSVLQGRQDTDLGRGASVIRASDDSFRVEWIEHRYVDGALASTERWSAIVTVVVQPPTDADTAETRIPSASTSMPSTGQRSSANAHLPFAAILLASAALRRLRDDVQAARRFSYDDTPKQAVLTPDPPKPVADRRAAEARCRCRVSSSRIPGAKKRRASRPIRTLRVRSGQRRRPHGADPRRLLNAIQVYPWSDGALYQVYAAPGRGHRHRAGARRAAGRLWAGRRRRHRALGHRRHRERHWPAKAHPHPGQADAAGPRRPTWSSTPTGAPITSSSAPTRRPTWPRSPGPIRRTSSSRCAGRTRRPRRQRPSPPASTSMR